MVEALLGIIIATTASVTLLITLGISNKAIKNAGRYNLTPNEINIVESAGYSREDIKVLEIDIRNINFD